MRIIPFVFLGILMTGAFCDSASAFENVSFKEQIRKELDKPADIAVAANNDIYVIDGQSGAIIVYNSAGTLLRSFGSRGSRDGQFRNAKSIALSPNNEIVVADTGNDRIQVFSLDGSMKFIFGNSGSNTGEFKSPSGVAIDSSGYIYVADTNNNRIQSFTAGGVYIGTLPLDFAPEDIALDPKRNIYLLSTKKERIIKYSSDGKRLTEFSCPINGRNYVKNATGLTVDNQGHVYISEDKEHSIKKFNESETIYLSFGSEGEGRGQFKSPRGLALDSNQRLIVADSENSRIQILQTSGGTGVALAPVEPFPALVDYDKKIPLREDIIDLQFIPENGLYALIDRDSRIIHKNDYRKVWGEKGRDAGQFRDPSALFVTEDGRVFIADTGNNRLQILNPDGTSQYLFGEQGSKPGFFSNPRGIAVNSTGKIYVADTNNDRIQIFNKDGIFLRAFGGTSKNDAKKRPIKGMFRQPLAVAINSHDEVYIIDNGNHRVQLFNEDGEFLTSFGEKGDQPGQFMDPVDVAIDEKDFVYVADRGNNRVQIFDSDSEFIIAFGSYGEGPGYFPNISAVTARNGQIYISDYKLSDVKVFSFDTHRIPKFTSNPTKQAKAVIDIQSAVPQASEPTESRIFVTKFFHLPVNYDSSNEPLNEQIRQLTHTEAINELSKKLNVSVDMLQSQVRIEREELTDNGRYKMTISAPNRLKKR